MMIKIPESRVDLVSINNKIDRVQTIAENNKIDPYEYNDLSALTSQKNAMTGWYGFCPLIQYNSTQGYFYKSARDTKKLTFDTLPNIFIINGYFKINNENHNGTAILSKTLMASSNKWMIHGNITTMYSGTMFIETPTMNRSVDTNIFFNPYPSREILLTSSTANSSKYFKITVDDSGTIKATEVTI